MAGLSGMFLFEVVVAKVNYLVTSQKMIIKSDFGDVFSLELRDPKTMHIVMPDPLPEPPEPPGKKKKKPKPKPKKGKKGAVVAPPPEPDIQSGQSVLFSSSPDFLIQSMNKYPLELSLWSKEDHLVFIGSVTIPWDPKFLVYLQRILQDQIPSPALLRDEFNIFEEGTAKMMAKVEMQIKLTYLADKLMTSFRALSEDLNFKKYLYTGINSKTTSYMCTLKTTDEDFEQNSNKIANKYTVDKPVAKKKSNIEYADYTNISGANLTNLKDNTYCCLGHADKPPNSIYQAAETCPDIDFIVDYVRKIIVSCNDNMRRLTPRPTISPRIKATDIDRYCYCKETEWPEGQLAERFKKEAQSSPCPICVDAGKKVKANRGETYDIANIRGPCGKPECRIARDIRAYIEHLVDEDNKEFNIDDVIGPCGSKDCTLAEKIQEFLQHRGAFQHGNTQEGLSTQCGCLEIMQKSLVKKDSCASKCSDECDSTGSDVERCEGEGCPFPNQKKVYHIYYFTVEHDFDKKSETTGSTPPANTEDNSTLFPYCPSTCPSVRTYERGSCSKSMCSATMGKRDVVETENKSKCETPKCVSIKELSPADSNIEINLNEIRNPCRIKACDVAEKVKDFVVENIDKNKEKKKCAQALRDVDDPCYCDCVCSFKISGKTTYCPVCGGYQCAGDDLKSMPDYAKPHPCPVYHKLYDKKYIKTKSPWPEEQKEDTHKESGGKSPKGPKPGPSSAKQEPSKVVSDKEVKETGNAKAKKKEPDPKKVVVNVVEDATKVTPEKKPKKSYRYPPVPKNMGWNWTAEDIPGLKVAQGWKPGAISKRLLKKLNKAKQSTLPVQKVKIAKKVKKNLVDKPKLIVCKMNGTYHIEMQVSSGNSEVNIEPCEPLIYKIMAEDNNERIQKRLRKRQSLVKKAVDEIWSDPYHPEVCEKTCLKAYKQAIGLLPYDPNNPECICTGKEVEKSSTCSCDDSSTDSQGSSLDLQWEIHFSPPSAFNAIE